MPSLQKRISERVAAIPPPKVLFTDNLRFQLPALFDSSAIAGDGIDFRCAVSRDLLCTLFKFQSPAIFEGKALGTFAPSIQSFDLAISPLVIEAEKLPLVIQRFTTISLLDHPFISGNLFEDLDNVRVMGMNYRDRMWRELRLPESREPTVRERRGTRPLSKSYVERVERKERKRHESKPKPPSFWDLMYAILQPPLVLEQLENHYLPHDLYTYQPEGIMFLMQRDSALLADEMGTGKTVMTTVALRILMQRGRAKCALVVCPLSVLREWNRHLEEWAPELLVTFVRGSQKARTTDWEMPAHVYVTTYDTLRSDIEKDILAEDKLDKFDIVVLDEAQNIKNPASSRSQAVKRLSARQRWALTGTPVENKLDDLVSLFEFLRPGYLTPFDLYPARIKEKIAPYFLRRLKKDVLPDLPPKLKQDIWLELDPDQAIAYEEVAEQVRDELSALGPRVTKMDVFQRIQRLKQVCNFAPGQLTSPKLELLKEQIEDIIESGQKVIVFSQYLAEGVDKLQQALAPYGTARLVGEQTEPNRNREIERFKNSDQIPILLASVRAGGVGLNLTEASYVVHFDHWWNPAVMWQAEARVHRPGQTQTRGVNVYSFWMLDTIDERIYRLLQEKGLLFEDVVDGLAETQVDELFSMDDLLDIVGVKHKEEVQARPKRQTFEDLSLSEIREKLYEIAPAAFESLVKELMRSLGYPYVKVTGRSHDGGIDVISTRNTSDGVVRAVAQCKRYRGTVGVEVARALMGVIASDKSIQKGFLVTSGDFSQECLRFCEKVGVIVPIYGLQVANYIKQFGLAV